MQVDLIVWVAEDATIAVSMYDQSKPVPGECVFNRWGYTSAGRAFAASRRIAKSRGWEIVSEDCCVTN